MKTRCTLLALVMFVVLVGACRKGNNSSTTTTTTPTSPASTLPWAKMYGTRIYHGVAYGLYGHPNDSGSGFTQTPYWDTVVGQSVTITKVTDSTCHLNHIIGGGGSGDYTWNDYGSNAQRACFYLGPNAVYYYFTGDSISLHYSDADGRSVNDYAWLTSN